MTKKEQDKLVTEALQTDAGKVRLARAILHGYPDLVTAMVEHYGPLLVKRRKRAHLRLIQGGKS